MHRLNFFISKLLLLLLGACVHVATSQIVDLIDYPAPEPHALSVVSFMHVLVPDQATHVRLTSFKISGNPNEQRGPFTEDASTYSSLELIVMPFDRFTEEVLTTKFCSDMDDVILGNAKDVNRFSVMRRKSSPGSFVFSVVEEIPDSLDIVESGKYVVALSNCGSLTGLRVTGSLVIQNQWGYLPAPETPKIYLYAILIFIWLILGGIFAFKSIRLWDHLFAFQIAILASITFALVEYLLMVIFLHFWNVGQFNQKILVLANAAHAWKMVVLIQGFYFDPFHSIWGNSRSSIAKQTLIGTSLAVFFFVSTFLRSRNRTLTSESSQFKFFGSTVLYLALVYKILWNKLELTCKKARAQERLFNLYSNLKLLSAAGIPSSIFCAIMWLWDPAMTSPSSWGYHICFADGLSESIFLVWFGVLASFAYPSLKLQAPLRYRKVSAATPTAIGTPDYIWA